MAIRTTCSGCGVTLETDDESAGRKAVCPNCGQIYTVPQLAGADNAEETREQHWEPSATGPSAGDDVLNAEAIPRSSQLNEDTGQDRSFWMMTDDEEIYGPVDRATLDRWFVEGRVGRNYRIREGAQGFWYPAEQFAPSPNPYASPTTSTDGSFHAGYSSTEGSGANTAVQQYDRPDPAPLVLTLGIVAWAMLLFCWPLGFVFAISAIVRGQKAFDEIDRGLAERRNRYLVEVGYYLAWAFLVVNLLLVMLAFIPAVLLLTRIFFVP